MAGVKGFLGSWREEVKEGYDHMADALGMYQIYFISVFTLDGLSKQHRLRSDAA